MKLDLVVAQGCHSGQVIPIAFSQFLIGRDRVCNLRPTNSQISPRHCAVLVRGERAFLRDFKTAAGTFVNDRAVQGEVELHDGDRLRVGGLALEVRMTTSGVAKAPAVTAPASEMPPSELDEAAIGAMLLGEEEGPKATLRKSDPSLESTIKDAPPEPVLERTSPQPAAAANRTSAAENGKQTTSLAAKALLTRYRRRPGQ